jgi:uncharacterized protein (DUF58 family)
VAGPAFPTRAQIEALATQYHFALPERQRAARIGELSGRRTGSSVEYQDRKDFAPGDDLRHVDWRGYARSDRMTVKLYREEITPTFDLVIDCSASMSVTDAKALRRMETAYLFWLLARKLHALVRVHAVGQQLRPLTSPLDLLRSSDTRQTSPLPLLRGSAASRPGGIKVFVSDLLFPFSPPDITTLFRDADRIVLVQVLSAFEEDPAEGLAPGSMFRLEDAEADHHLDVRLDPATIDGYKQRLHALQNDTVQWLRPRNGTMATIRDDDNLEQMMRKLLAAGAVIV